MSAALGDRLREERQKTGKNQEAFGMVGGVSRRSQAEYESGKTPPNTDYLERISESGIDIAYVLTGRRTADSLGPSDQVMIEAFRRLDEPAQRSLLMLIGRLLWGEQGKAADLVQTAFEATLHSPSDDYRAPR